jgi:hypothetical protein
MTTAAVPTTQSPLDNITYEDLYRRWEVGNWRATELDFTKDAEQWRTEFTEFERKAAYWNYCLFFWGEDAVADGLSPYVDAAPLEEQKYFLTTQQVDEARHAVFFNRFMKEVVGVGGDSVGDSLRTIKPELTWGFEKVFGRLEKMCDELRRNPSIPQLAAGVALYHVIIEATLAQPGQHFITSYLEDRDVLPGFRAGMENVAADEQRHIGFGVKLLNDLRKMDPEVPYAVADLLREVMPWTINVLVPPGWDERYITTFGVEMEDLGEEGATSLETKLRSAGMPLEELPGPPVFPIEGTPRERAIRGKKMCKAGYLGEKLGPSSKDPEDVQVLFESVANSLDTSAARSPGVIQWDFRDCEPWHVVVSNGSTHAVRGRADNPTVRFECAFEDWVDVIADRQDPRKLVARGKLRPRGNLRWLFGSRKMFPSA